MIQFTASQAEKYRQLINKTAVNLTDDEAAYVPMMFERWAAGVAYEVGHRVCYEDKLYKVLQAHTSQDSWTPDVAVSLFAEVLIPDPSVVPEWVQPSSTNPYMTGDKVRHNGKVWISTMDYNVFEPGIAGWNEVE
ncbi:MAG: hypothetical protein IIX90_00530 [Clostridia bacterium]|nr:hypothetical protein [Clostridia bacterium]